MRQEPAVRDRAGRMTMRRVAASIAAVLLVLAGCSGGATSSPAPTVAPSVPATPAPSPSPAAAPTPSSTPSSVPTPAATPVAISDLAWERVTTIEGVALGGDMVGFAGGYVVLGESGVLWSADGEAWTAIPIPSRVVSIATDGRTVLLVGSEERDCAGECPPETTGCGGPTCKATPIAWRSTDGLRWERSKAWPVAPVDTDAYMALDSTAWAVPTGGWDVVLSYVTGDTGHLIGVFHSNDGISWAALPGAPPASIPGSAENSSWGPGAADAAGRRVLAGWALAGDPVIAALYTSADGESWIWLEGFPEPGLMVSDVVAPTARDRPLWLVAGTGAIDPEDNSGKPTAWVSPDLVEWSGQSLAMGDAANGTLGALAPTGFGYVAVGSIYETPDSAPTGMSWVSVEGADWIRLAVPVEPGIGGPVMVADGPAGVIGISQPDDSEDPPLPAFVWALR
jgi:hypothetical protein